MLLQTTAQKIVFSVRAVFLLITAGKDWFDFYSCGAVSQCLSDSGTLQLYTKSVMTTMLTILAFITASSAFSGRDGKLLRAAFVFSLLADYSFSLIKAFVPDAGTISTVLGITFFMVFQTILIYRHSRKSADIAEAEHRSTVSDDRNKIIPACELVGKLADHIVENLFQCSHQPGFPKLVQGKRKTKAGTAADNQRCANPFVIHPAASKENDLSACRIRKVSKMRFCRSGA